MSQNFFPVSKQNSLYFPCPEKVRTKFPVFPVPWLPCYSHPYYDDDEPEEYDDRLEHIRPDDSLHASL